MSMKNEQFRTLKKNMTLYTFNLCIMPRETAIGLVGFLIAEFQQIIRIELVALVLVLKGYLFTRFMFHRSLPDLLI